MDWKDVGQKIISILGPASSIAAPFLSLIPGGAMIPTAITAIKAISAVLGIKDDNPTPDMLLKAIDANPQAAADLTKAQMAYEHEVTMTQMAYEAQSRTEQAGITLQDAKDLRFWNSGWRPYIGWVIGTSMAVYYIPQSFMATVVWVIAIQQAKWVLVPYPNTFDMTELLTLLGSILGLGGLKAFEKIKGVTK